MKKTDVVILPMDGFAAVSELVGKLGECMDGDVIPELVGIVKVNDALHFPLVGPEILFMMREVFPGDLETMIDLKIADVSETIKNTLRHYQRYEPGIVTVTSTVKAKSLMVAKETLPDTKIAIVDTLTDISEAEILDRYGMIAAEKIMRALSHFEKYLKDDNPIDLVVCSPRELPRLKAEFGDRYEYITPGIRSPHMAKDHQERVTSAFDALTAGSRYLVMGTQLTKGNPDKGISAELSQAITLKEIERFFAEQEAQ